MKFAEQIQNVLLFTDSTIVLAWLKTPPYLLKTFVANRVVQILENTPNAICNKIIIIIFLRAANIQKIG